VRALTPTSQDLRRGAQYGDARAMISVLNLENDCQADSASRRLRWLSRWKETLDTASQCLRLGTGDRPDHALRESTRAQRFSGETAVGWSECANGATFRAGPKTRVPRPRLGATCTTYRYGLISCRDPLFCGQADSRPLLRPFDGTVATGSNGRHEDSLT